MPGIAPPTGAGGSEALLGYQQGVLNPQFQQYYQNPQLRGGIDSFLGAGQQGSGITTEDMVIDPLTGKPVPRAQFEQQYGTPSQQNEIAGRIQYGLGSDWNYDQNSGGFGRGDMGIPKATMGGAGQRPVGKSPFGQSSFGTGFGPKKQAMPSFGNPSGRSRYERQR